MMIVFGLIAFIMWNGIAFFILQALLKCYETNIAINANANAAIAIFSYGCMILIGLTAPIVVLMQAIKDFG